ncbi:hypothetical protein HFO93_04860 [Rhizobium leguminosarum]|uniref:hypothetical protein n=1 Tax=Rhizobium leguminosarum TaxID=384 RepID=UPI001C93B05A|nr:hypothetical protein [Rhizobium leguminosarum]MBY5442812.1 hypothetical protein [Rhizobium leguminosarum]
MLVESKKATQTQDPPLFLSQNASFWLGDAGDLARLKQELEAALGGFSYYPEIEWNLFGFRPPEGLPFFGAWRNADRTEFVYLVGEETKKTGETENRLLLIMSAQGAERLTILSGRFDKATARFRRIEKQNVAGQSVTTRRKSFLKDYASTRVTAVFSVVAIALNVTSRSLRQLQPPQSKFEFLNAVYDFGLMAVHILSLLSLILLGFFVVAYFARHLIFMMRSL